jgi:hypothetical protein
MLAITTLSATKTAAGVGIVRIMWTSEFAHGWNTPHMRRKQLLLSYPAPSSLADSILFLAFSMTLSVQGSWQAPRRIPALFIRQNHPCTALMTSHFCCSSDNAGIFLQTHPRLAPTISNILTNNLTETPSHNAQSVQIDTSSVTFSDSAPARESLALRNCKPAQTSYIE